MDCIAQRSTTCTEEWHRTKMVSAFGCKDRISSAAVAAAAPHHHSTPYHTTSHRTAAGHGLCILVPVKTGGLLLLLLTSGLRINTAQVCDVEPTVCNNRKLPAAPAHTASLRNPGFFLLIVDTTGQGLTNRRHPTTPLVTHTLVPTTADLSGVSPDTFLRRLGSWLVTPSKGGEGLKTNLNPNHCKQ